MQKPEGIWAVSEAVHQATKKQKDKLKPKPITAQNAKAAADRKLEKAAIVAQGGGKLKPAVGAKGVSKPGSGSAGARPGDVAGGKSQWMQLLQLLERGGREETAGLGAVDFGVGLVRGVLSKGGREEKQKHGLDKYEQLPESIRDKLSRKEFEELDYRGDEEEAEAGSDGGGLLPVVVFCFSKKKCEEIVDYYSGQNLLSAREKASVGSMISRVLKRLNPLDARLPQVLRVSDMLSRGFGVHHGGLLPLLKECVELLFSRSLVRVLIATETFAMGVNMPARWVTGTGPVGCVLRVVP